MNRYAATFFKRTGGEEFAEIGEGRTMPDGLRAAWAKLSKADQRGIVKAKVGDGWPGEKIIQYDLRAGRWVRVGRVEANKAVKPLEEEVD